jgi:hypothetical protein
MSLFATKSSTGLMMAFPDVCTMPAPQFLTGVPVPYPTVATTATEKRAKVAGRKSLGSVYKSVANEPASAGGGVKSKITPTTQTLFAPTSVGGSAVLRYNEANQLRNILQNLTAQLMNLPAGNPDQWQAMLQSYAATASALYLTITDD